MPFEKGRSRLIPGNGGQWGRQLGFKLGFRNLGMKISGCFLGGQKASLLLKTNREYGIEIESPDRCLNTSVQSLRLLL